jgi:hypothetical protein
MNTQKMKLATGIFLLALLLPETTSAYFTTAQSATKINADTILYTVTYHFGFTDRELYMPIVATRDLEADASTFQMGYNIIIDKAPTTLGASQAIVLSSNKDIQIKDGKYYLPKGKSADFTLMTLLTVPKETQTAEQDLSLLVTNLPFLMIKDGANISAHLNPSELQYYHTPAVAL